MVYVLFCSLNKKLLAIFHLFSVTFLCFAAAASGIISLTVFSGTSPLYMTGTFRYGSGFWIAWGSIAGEYIAGVLDLLSEAFKTDSIDGNEASSYTLDNINQDT